MALYSATKNYKVSIRGNDCSSFLSQEEDVLLVYFFLSFFFDLTLKGQTPHCICVDTLFVFW